MKSLFTIDSSLISYLDSMATADSIGVSSLVECAPVRARATHVLRRADLASHPCRFERLAATAIFAAPGMTLTHVGSTRRKHASGTSNTIPVPAGAAARIGLESTRAAALSPAR